MHGWDYIQHITDHPEVKIYPLDHALAKSFNPSIFGMKQVQEDLLQTTSLPNIMEGLDILDPRQEAPLNHVTPRSSIYHYISDIF